MEGRKRFPALRSHTQATWLRFKVGIKLTRERCIALLSEGNKCRIAVPIMVADACEKLRTNTFWLLFDFESWSVSAMNFR
ncbi:hypothetical protein BSV11_20595 [Salmonella enterica subsp. enterica serovar Enteritidis]|nr:hypothetical protein BSV11_20595 [Salmonella enterica subsp. enterica serovar Enteritidis]